jgi:argininosuccinate lyase
LPSVSTRAFEKLLARLPLIDKNDICQALLETEASAANDAITALNNHDYRTAHEITGELYDVIEKFESVAGCPTKPTETSPMVTTRR